MTAHIPVNGMDHNQVQSEKESPLEAAWSEEEEEDCVPLKQRMKMLRATVLSGSREENLISDRSPVDVVKKDDDLRESLGFHSDQDRREGRSNGASSEAPEVENNDVQDRVLSERPELKYNDTEISEEFLEDLDNVVLKERKKMLLSRASVGSTGPSMERKLSDPCTNSVDMILPNAMESGSFDDIPACAPARTNKHQETTLPKSQNYKNAKVEPLDEDLQTPNKDVPISPCLGTQVSVKSEPSNSAGVLEDIIDHMMLRDKMRLLASRKFPKTSFLKNFDSRTFMSFDNGDKPTISESSKPLLMKRPRKRRKTATAPVGSTGPSMERELSGPCTNSVDMILPNAMESGSFDDISACAPARSKKYQETTLPKSKNYQNVKVEPLYEDLQTPKKDVPVSPCLGTQISVKSEPLNSAEVLEDIIDHMMLGDRMRLLASRKFPKTNCFDNSENSRAFMSFDNGDKPTVLESSKPLLVKRPRKRRKTVTAPVGSTGPSMERNLSDPCTNSVDLILPNAMESGSFDDIPACAPTRKNKHQETTLPKSQNYQNVKVEPLDEDLQTPNKDVQVSPCLGTQVSVKSEPANSAEVLEDIIDHMLLGDRMRLLASRKFPKTSFFENSDSRTFRSFDNGDKPTVSESSKPLLMKRPRKRRKTAT